MPQEFALVRHSLIQNLEDPTDPKQKIPGVAVEEDQKSERLPPPDKEDPTKEKELNLPEATEEEEEDEVDRSMGEGVERVGFVEITPCQSSSSSMGGRMEGREDMMTMGGCAETK